VRQRWFGATGTQVPEIAVEGEDELELDAALVLDGLGDLARLQEAHDQGVPIVVRASDEESVQAALERPEVSCVLVSQENRDLRDLDFRRLKYG
jgi:hypothetical protein